MPFYPAAPSGVTSSAGGTVSGLPGEAQMVAVRVADLASPAGQGLGKDGRSALVATGGCRPPGIRLTMPGWAWLKNGWTRWPADRTRSGDRAGCHPEGQGEG